MTLQQLADELFPADPAAHTAMLVERAIQEFGLGSGEFLRAVAEHIRTSRVQQEIGIPAALSYLAGSNSPQSYQPNRYAAQAHLRSVAEQSIGHNVNETL